MVRLIALIISVVLQIVAASIALRFMKLTKYRLSWILLSLSFVFMAARLIFQLFEYFLGSPFTWQMVDQWTGVLISVMIFVGVILMRELFYSLKRAEIDRLRSEKRVINAIINTEENERKRFAKDLHDGLGPLMSTVKMSLSALSERIKDQSGTDILNNTNYLVNEAINTLEGYFKQPQSACIVKFRTYQRSVGIYGKNQPDQSHRNRFQIEHGESAA